jgi:hypothetical protein
LFAPGECNRTLYKTPLRGVTGKFKLAAEFIAAATEDETAMRALSFEQYLKATGLKETTFRGQEHRGEFAGAFGLQRRLAAGTMLDLDLVAHFLVEELAPAFTRVYAAKLVHSFSDEWLKGIRIAEIQAEPVWFMVSEYGDKRVRGYAATRDQQRVAVVTFNGVGPFVDPEHPKRDIPARMTFVNLKDILRRARTSAAKAGLDFSAPFFPHPEDPMAAKVIATAKKQREVALQMYQQDRIARADQSEARPQ